MYSMQVHIALSILLASCLWRLYENFNNKRLRDIQVLFCVFFSFVISLDYSVEDWIWALEMMLTGATVIIVLYGLRYKKFFVKEN